MFTRQAICVIAVTLALLLGGCVPPQTLMRHVAEFRFGPEQLTTSTATGIGTGGDPIYLKTFNLPAGQNTLFVTLSTTGDTHGGAASWFSTLVNGTVCNPGDEGAGVAPGGWIPLQKHRDSGPGGDGGGGPGDLHDNGIYYTWCCSQGVQPGGSNTVEIRMASSIPGQFVFVERSHYYIDSVQAKLCTEAGPIPGAAVRMKAMTEAMPPGHRNPNQPPEQKPPS
jgi:hypothetical protein